MTAAIRAQQAALAALAEVTPATTDIVEYVSRGRIAVFVPSDRRADAENAAGVLAEQPQWFYGEAAETPVREVRGHLGAFEIIQSNSETIAADTIVDFYRPPLARRFNSALTTLPPGYIAADNSENAAQKAFAEAESLRGVFHKPRYFQYHPSLCAHSASNIRGCERCLIACPAQAIESAGDKITVNSNLCQGCGLCVMTCPSGAMRYAYPPPGDTIRALRNAIAAYRQQSANAPTVVFYAAECAEANEIPEDPLFIPVAVEEAGAVGIEIWLCALAYGAAKVAVLADNPRLAALAKAQAEIVAAMTEALGFRNAVTIYQDAKSIEPAQSPALAEAASFAAVDDKRTMFFMALNHFVAAATNPPDATDLPDGAPFGEIVVDGEKCTLCMACAGVCPAAAVRAGNDAPRLSFVELNCLQCGLCEKACPEDAIRLRPRMLFSSDARQWLRVLNEDRVIKCLQCGKPFASARIIERIEEKLKAHWMFRSDAERRRLRLCEDCRVVDMFDK